MHPPEVSKSTAQSILPAFFMIKLQLIGGMICNKLPAAFCFPIAEDRLQILQHNYTTRHIPQDDAATGGRWRPSKH